MANITEYLKQIQSLTNKNLEILEAINQAFFTKKTNTTVTLGDNNYVIPSFLALESKIQLLEDNFENLVNAPKTGEAAFNFNGNTQEILLRTYKNTPETVKADSLPSTYSTETNNIFKDLLSPNPFIKFDLTSLPDDIKRLNVRKLVFKSSKGKDVAEGLLAGSVSAKVSYTDMLGSIFNLVEDVDYIVYDKVYDMPVRDCSKTAKFHINKIENNYIDENLNEWYELYVDEDLVLTDEDGNTYPFEVNERDGKFPCLLCNDGKTKLEVNRAIRGSHYLKVRVLYGSYANLVTTESGDTSLSTLEFFDDRNHDDLKYVKVPLEEDKYIIVFINAINDLNVRSLNEEGYVIDAYSLKKDGSKSTFGELYKEYNNIGDKLESIVTLFENGLNTYGEADYKTLAGIVPVKDTVIYEVKQINAHLNSSTTVETIRELYAQKQQAKKSQANVMNEIKKLQEYINKIDFNDTTGAREIYIQQLNDKNAEWENLQAKITKIVDNISDEANKSVLPVDNAKYHIRGFHDVLSGEAQIKRSLSDINEPVQIIAVETWYRYKNQNSLAGNAMSIGESNLFSDWNIMDLNYRGKNIEYKDNKPIYTFEPVNSSENVPSFNQIDIPITQGELVDIKFRYVYDLGYPFIKVCSDWSDTLTVEFPEDLQENVEILDIINENNDEVKKNAFDGILTKYGVQDHVGDKIQDNDTTFFHDAATITSGFYTEEQRVISLKEKLLDLNNKYLQLSDEINQTNFNELTVTMSSGNHVITLGDNADNTFVTSSYTDLKNTGHVLRYGNKEPIAHEEVSLLIQNKSNRTIRLYSMFPGNKGKGLERAAMSKFNVSDYLKSDGMGIAVLSAEQQQQGASSHQPLLQHYDQMLYFRINNLYTGEDYYADSDVLGTNNKLKLGNNGNLWYNSLTILDISSQYSPTISAPAMTVIPYVYNLDNIQLSNNERYKILNPGEGIKITLVCDFVLDVAHKSIEKTISFDVWTSPFEQPKNYIVKIKANLNTAINDDDSSKNRYNTTIIN